MENAHANNARAMEKYLRYQFPFFGIKTSPRRKILKELWRKHERDIAGNPRQIARQLLKLPEREFHYSAQEILIKVLKDSYLRSDKKLIKEMITTNSWWDTVDFLAKYLLGNYLIQYPEETGKLIKEFSDSNNMWLNRSAILFQLSYKENTNPLLLFSECEKHSGSKEFFIQKAIGWALREYHKTDPSMVEDFVQHSDLQPLSKREALRNR